MLLTEYIPESDLYIVIPIINRRPDYLNGFVFETEEDQAEFIKHYRRNPNAAIFTYEAWQSVQCEVEFEL